MKTAILLASALCLTPASTLAQQPSHEPLRNTFVTASESVIDTASAININAAPAVFDAQMQNLKAIKANLDAMADSDQEKDVAKALNDMIFTVSACHLQAADGTDTTKCTTQFSHARQRAMEAISVHKDGSTWLPGPPA